MKIRPTRHAVVFFFILGAMFLASINYQSNAAWLMVFLVFATGCTSAAHGVRNALPAEIAAGDPPLVQAGDRARLPLTVRSTAARELIALVVEVPPDSMPPGVGAAHRLLVPHVAALGSARAELALPPFGRGVHRIDTLLVSTQYPLGLFRIVRPIAVRLELHVHPAPLGVPLAQAQPDPDAEDADGVGRTAREYEDFRGLRTWQQGESFRHVDWKAAARGNGPLLVKEYAGGGSGITWLAWAATAGDDEARLSQLAKWVIEAHHEGLCYGLRLPGAEIGPSTGVSHHHECLRALAAFVPGPRSSARRPAVAMPPVDGPRPGSSASVSGPNRVATGRIARADIGTGRVARAEPGTGRIPRGDPP